MAFLLDYIGSIDTRRLEAAEVSQCLLYLDHLDKADANNRKDTRRIRERLNERLSELREARDPR